MAIFKSEDPAATDNIAGSTEDNHSLRNSGLLAGTFIQRLWKCPSAQPGASHSPIQNNRVFQRELERSHASPHTNQVWLLLIINLAGKVAAICVGFADPAVSVTLWLLPDALLAYHLFVPRAQGLVRVHQRFKTKEREVWLTIDDGPDPADTPKILELLATHDARATFFIIGENAVSHPELITAIQQAGHEVAHHTHTHPVGSFWCASPLRLAQELDASLAMLKTVGIAPTRFRPPVGIKNIYLANALKSRGLACIGWSARGLERWHSSADKIAMRVTHQVASGAILLLHEGPRVPTSVRVEAIRHTLARLQSLGFRCVIPSAQQLISD